MTIAPIDIVAFFAALVMVVGWWSTYASQRHLAKAQFDYQKQLDAAKSAVESKIAKAQSENEKKLVELRATFEQDRHDRKREDEICNMFVAVAGKWERVITFRLLRLDNDHERGLTAEEESEYEQLLTELRVGLAKLVQAAGFFGNETVRSKSQSLLVGTCAAIAQACISEIPSRNFPPTAEQIQDLKTAKNSLHGLVSSDAGTLATDALSHNGVGQWERQN